MECLQTSCLDRYDTCTGVYPLPEPGACVGEEATLADPDFETALESCGTSCFLEGSGFTDCANRCLAAEVDLSGQCRECVVVAGECMLDRCSDECDTDFRSAECNECLVSRCFGGIATCATDPNESFVCLNEDDLTALGSSSIEQEIFDCYEDNPDDENAREGCVVTALGVTNSCGGCWEDFSTCAQDTCGAPCSPGNCGACHIDACGAELAACSGLDPASDFGRLIGRVESTLDILGEIVVRLEGNGIVMERTRLTFREQFPAALNFDFPLIPPGEYTLTRMLELDGDRVASNEEPAIVEMITVEAGTRDLGVTTFSNFTPDCATYCEIVEGDCVIAGLGQYPRGGCLQFCTQAAWEVGALGNSDNTLMCRVVAAADAPVEQTRCVDAGPSGGDNGAGCGDLCDVYCEAAMAVCDGENSIYASVDSCQMACLGMDMTGDPGATGGDSVQCRIQWLVNAASGNPTAGCVNAAEMSAACSGAP